MKLFTEGMDGNIIFRDKHVFSKSYIPKEILHRDKEKKSLVDNLSWIFKGVRPNDTILYGKRGTGKTLITKYVTGELEKETQDVKIYNINLRNKKTNFRAWKEIAKTVLGKDVPNRDAVDVSNIVYEYVTTLEQKFTILILDEINEVTEGYDDLLYYLLRPHEVYSKMADRELTCIFITNSMNYPSNLSEGTLSSFKLVDKYAYNPYTAPQLVDILMERAMFGLNDGVYDETIIGLCSAYGSQEHGDARETIKLLEKAAELASRDGSGIISEDHVKQALGAVEFDKVTSVLNTLPIHQKTLALACIRDYKRVIMGVSQNFKCKPLTVYEEYMSMCTKMGLLPLGYRRITDFFNELATLGLISLETTHSGGQQRFITVIVPLEVEKALTLDSRFDMFSPA